MSNWRYACDLGLDATNTGAGTIHVFVDAIRGNDANNGSTDSPVQTIQQAIMIVNSRGRVICASGTYSEGDFTRFRSNLTLIAEGTVFLDGTSQSSFSISLNLFQNINSISGNSFDYGVFKANLYSTFNSIFGENHNIEFYNISGVIGILANTSRIDNIKYVNCSEIIYNCVTLSVSNITSINSNLEINSLNGGIVKFVNSVTDVNTNIVFSSSGGSFGLIDFNHLQGSVEFLGNSFANGNDWSVWSLINTTQPHAQNDLDSSVNPNYNNVTGNPLEDTTYVTADLGTFSSSTGSFIGYYGRGKSLNGSIGSPTLTNLTNNIGVLTVTDSNTNGGVGVAEWSSCELDTSPVLITNIPSWFDVSIPDDDDLNPAPFNTNIPNVYSLEIALSDDDLTYTPFIKVPFNTQPLVDDAGLGNADPLFDCNTGVEVSARFLNIRVTMAIST